MDAGDLQFGSPRPPNAWHWAVSAGLKAGSTLRSVGGTNAAAQRTLGSTLDRRRVLVGLALALIAVLAVRLVVDRLVLPPDRFRPNPPGVEGSIVEVPMPGDTLVFQVAHNDSGVRPTNIELVVADGSSVAAATVVACRMPEGAGRIGALVNVLLDEWCDLADPTKVEVDGDQTYLLAVVQPLTSGRIVIDGVRVTHARGPFHRTEHTGETMEITVG